MSRTAAHLSIKAYLPCPHVVADIIADEIIKHCLPIVATKDVEAALVGHQRVLTAANANTFFAFGQFPPTVHGLWSQVQHHVLRCGIVRERPQRVERSWDRWGRLLGRQGGGHRVLCSGKREARCGFDFVKKRCDKGSYRLHFNNRCEDSPDIIDCNCSSFVNLVAWNFTILALSCNLIWRFSYAMFQNDLPLNWMHVTERFIQCQMFCTLDHQIFVRTRHRY